jgi:hypothetical protein
MAMTFTLTLLTLTLTSPVSCTLRLSVTRPSRRMQHPAPAMHSNPLPQRRPGALVLLRLLARRRRRLQSRA